MLAGYRRTAGDRGRGQARPFGVSDLAAVLATCHRPRRRGLGVESDQVAAERGRRAGWLARARWSSLEGVAGVSARSGATRGIRRRGDQISEADLTSLLRLVSGGFFHHASPSNSASSSARSVRSAASEWSQESSSMRASIASRTRSRSAAGDMASSSQQRRP